MKWVNKRRPNSALGLTIDGHALHAVFVKISRDTIEVEKDVSTQLKTDLLSHDPAIVGREIKDFLKASGINEKNCMVGLPLNWAFSVHSKLPALEAEDVADFLQLEAERGFPTPVDELQTTLTNYTSPNGEPYATQVGVSRSHLKKLQEVLTAAGLKPTSFALAIAALPGALPKAGSSVITALVGENRIDLLIAFGTSIVSIRTIEMAFDDQNIDIRANGEMIFRELRITLGQLPRDISGKIDQINLFGNNPKISGFLEVLKQKLSPMGMTVRHIQSYSGTEGSPKISTSVKVSPEAGLAARRLSQKPDEYWEYLEAPPSFWSKVSTRYSSRQLVYPVTGAAAVALLLIGMFGYQQYQLTQLRAEWAGMKKNVDQYDALQGEMRKYRPWFSSTSPNLTILARMSEAFPEAGSVSAKTVDIRNSANVSCSGVATDKNSLYKTLAALRALNQIDSLALDSLKGSKAPVQFTFNFHWSESSKP
ncbi:MAG: hypothetical protein JWN25_2700 [Verrucomicrobiales bacterium]|nr:hypothetical protein [Verrucomicrobiales bacterium]